MRKPSESQKVALEMLEQIERNRSGAFPLEALEEKLWRLLDRVGPGFPATLAGQIEEMVQNLRRLQQENRSFGPDIDEDRGADVVYNEVINAISRYLN